MNTIDFSTYKIHCSSLPKLMTKSRSKTDILSETAKSYLLDIYIEEVYGRKNINMIGNKYTRKGIECETDSIDLVSKLKGKKYFKNNEQLHNDYVCGTPDVTAPDLVDVKTSWDLHTFAAVDEKKAMKDYAWQLKGYQWMTGSKTSTLAYCLVNTPEILITDALYRLSFSVPEDQTEQYRHNFIFDDIPEKKRMKSYEILWDDGDANTLISMVQAAREYLLTIQL